MKKIIPKLNVKFSSLAESLGVSTIGNTIFFFLAERKRTQCFFSEGNKKY